jgi:hypothetical protein
MSSQVAAMNAGAQASALLTVRPVPGAPNNAGHASFSRAMQAASSPQV